MYLAHVGISVVFFSLVNQLLEAQVRHSQSHAIMLQSINLRYADDTSLMAESEEELKSPWGCRVRHDWVNEIATVCI